MPRWSRSLQIAILFLLGYRIFRLWSAQSSVSEEYALIWLIVLGSYVLNIFLVLVKPRIGAIITSISAGLFFGIVLYLSTSVSEVLFQMWPEILLILGSLIFLLLLRTEHSRILTITHDTPPPPYTQPIPLTGTPSTEYTPQESKPRLKDDPLPPPEAIIGVWRSRSTIFEPYVVETFRTPEGPYEYASRLKQSGGFFTPQQGWKLGDEIAQFSYSRTYDSDPERTFWHHEYKGRFTKLTPYLAKNSSKAQEVLMFLFQTNYRAMEWDLVDTRIGEERIR